MTDGETRTVSGRIVFHTAVEAPGATVRVLVEDVSRADAAADVVAASATTLCRAYTAGEAMPFSLEVPADAQGRLNVRVHVDRSGDGTKARGDLITMQAYPVLTQGAPAAVDVEVDVI